MLQPVPVASAQTAPIRTARAPAGKQLQLEHLSQTNHASSRGPIRARAITGLPRRTRHGLLRSSFVGQGRFDSEGQNVPPRRALPPAPAPRTRSIRVKHFRCYGRCQDRPDPKTYLKCLSACPGFEETRGVACEKYGFPLEAACLTARDICASAEVPPGLIVLAVVGAVMLVVGASSLCASSSSQCGLVVPPR